MNQQPGSVADAERIIQAALNAFGRGAGRIGIKPSAVESLRDQFMPKVCSALERPDWHEDWTRERVYMVAYAEALGQRAKVLAAADRRSVIMPQDIDAASIKLLGYLPIAGRWCPV